MKEIILKGNLSDKRCFIDDLPIKELIPEDQISIFMTALAREVAEIIHLKQKRKEYYENKKLNKIPP